MWCWRRLLKVAWIARLNQSILKEFNPEYPLEELMLKLQYFVHLMQVQFSHSVVSDFLQLRGLQHSRPPYPSPTPGVNSNSCPLSRWCHPTILSSVVPFSSCLQSFPASRSFQMSQFSVSGGQSTGISASASVIPSLLQHHSSKESILWCSAFFIVQLSHPYMTTGKTIAFTRRTFDGKGLCFLINLQ